MATNTPIQSATLTASASSFTFNNIDQTYTDLVLVISGAAAGGTGGNVWLQFNGDTSSSLYSRTRVLGDGSTPSSERQASISHVTVGDAANGEPIGMTINLFQYSNFTSNKSLLSRSYSSNYVSLYTGLWRNTAPITSITFTMGAQNIAAGTTFNLYGIRSGGTSKASGGDYIITDGTYWYHAFFKSSVFTPAVPNLSCDILLVGGGGAGASGGNYGSGGGAGGVMGLSSTVLTTTNYPVLIGAGGSGATYSGNDSSFSTLLTALKGGGGGGGAGQRGGSSGNGYIGGLTADANSGGGGGAGAGANGSNSGSAGSATGGAGGTGINNAVSWQATGISLFGINGSAYLGGGGGGGGGGAGGTGGGGSGGSPAGNNGTQYTGAGGGGGVNSTAGQGASGCAIVRYAV